MMNRKKIISNSEETGVKLYWHREAMVYFGATGRGIEHFIPGLEAYYEDHMTVLEDVVIQTAFDSTEYRIFPTCPGQVEKVLELLKGTRLMSPSIQVSLDLFKATYGIKNDEQNT